MKDLGEYDSLGLPDYCGYIAERLVIFDVKSIEDPGDYGSVLSMFTEATAGLWQLENLKIEGDLDKKVVVSFDSVGQGHRFTLKQDSRRWVSEDLHKAINRFSKKHLGSTFMEIPLDDMTAYVFLPKKAAAAIEKLAWKPPIELMCDLMIVHNWDLCPTEDDFFRHSAAGETLFTYSIKSTPNEADEKPLADHHRLVDSLISDAELRNLTLFSPLYPLSHTVPNRFNEQPQDVAKSLPMPKYVELWEPTLCTYADIMTPSDSSPGYFRLLSSTDTLHGLLSDKRFPQSGLYFDCKDDRSSTESLFMSRKNSNMYQDYLYIVTDMSTHENGENVEQPGRCVVNSHKHGPDGWIFLKDCGEDFDAVFEVIELYLAQKLSSNFKFPKT